MDVKVGGSLTRANRDDLDKLLDVQEELEIPVRVDTYMMPATRERDLPYNMQSRLNPEEAAQARIHALKREMGPELFPQYVQQSICRRITRNRQKQNRGHMSCMAGQCSFTINWQGEMRPCVILSEPLFLYLRSALKMRGSILWRMTGKILLNAKCSTCHMRHLCRTCAASALLETGSYDGVPGLYVPVCGRVFEITERRMGEDTEWTGYFRSVTSCSDYAVRRK